MSPAPETRTKPSAGNGASVRGAHDLSEAYSYLLFGLAFPATLATMILVRVAFIGRRGRGALISFGFDHPLAIACFVMGGVALGLAIWGAMLMRRVRERRSQAAMRVLVEELEVGQGE